MAKKKRSKGARASKAERVSSSRRVEERKKKKRPRAPAKPAKARTAKKTAKKSVKRTSRKPSRKPSRQPFADLSAKELGRAFGIGILLRMQAEQRKAIERAKADAERQHRAALERIEKVRKDQEKEGFVRPQEWIRQDGTPAKYPSFLRHLNNADELMHFLETGERDFKPPLLGLIADIDKRVIYDPVKLKEIVQQIKEETGASNLREVYTLFWSP